MCDPPTVAMTPGAHAPAGHVAVITDVYVMVRRAKEVYVVSGRFSRQSSTILRRGTDRSRIHDTSYTYPYTAIRGRIGTNRR